MDMTSLGARQSALSIAREMGFEKVYYTEGNGVIGFWVETAVMADGSSVMTMLCEGEDWHVIRVRLNAIRYWWAGA